MIKPQDYDTVQAYEGQGQLPPGGYVCKIMQVLETTAKSSGAPMIKISIDIAEGNYKDHFASIYRADKNQDKKWKGVVNQLIYDPNGANSTNKGFKTFTTAVEKSNPNFVIQWGDRFGECFKGKLIGIVFRREEFIGDDGMPHFSTKPAWFRSVDEIRKGVSIPADKLLDGSSSYPRQSYPPQAVPAPQQGAIDLSDFEEIPVPDGNLPF